MSGHPGARQCARRQAEHLERVRSRVRVRVRVRGEGLGVRG